MAWILALAPSSKADCVPPGQYDLNINSNTNMATVCYSTYLGSCPGGDCAAILFRQNTATGEVMQFEPSGWNANGWKTCLYDECVPAGSYFYGLAKPMDCGCTTTYYHTDAAVFSADPPSDCKRMLSTSAPTSYAGQVPWGSDNEVCPGQNEDIPGGSNNGCSTRGRTSRVVLGVDIALAAIGLLGMALRRRAAK